MWYGYVGRVEILDEDELEWTITLQITPLAYDVFWVCSKWCVPSASSLCSQRTRNTGCDASEHDRNGQRDAQDERCWPQPAEASAPMV